MTTVRIGEKDFPWPEGCGCFKESYGHAFFVFPLRKFSSMQTMLRIDENEHLHPLFAAVAARHFDNEWRRAYDKQVAIINDRCKLDIEVAQDDAEYVTLGERMDACEQAADAWEQLCNDL